MYTIEVARELVRGASASGERWERLVSVLELDPEDDKSRDANRTLVRRVESSDADPDTLTVYASELRLLMGEGRFEKVQA